MRTVLRRDLTAALKARDQVSIAALRSALAAIDNAEAPPVDHAKPVPGETNSLAGRTEVEPRYLSESDLHAIVEAEVRERSRAAQEYEQFGRHDLAQGLRAEVDVLSRYLPADGP